MSTIAPEEIEEIKELAQKANVAGMSAAQFGIERCRICVQVGDKLRAWKKVLKHGEFGAVRDKIGLSVGTVSKWMRASQAVEDGKISLEDVNGIRDLYVLLGIVPKKQASNEPKQSKPVELSHVTLAAKLIESLRALPVQGWTMLQKRNLADILRPIVDFHRKL